MISLAVIRTTPVTPAGPLLIARAAASAAACISSTRGSRSSAALVGVRPWGERVNRATPSPASSAAICRPSVGWVRPSARAAADRLPWRITSRNEA